MDVRVKCDASRSGLGAALEQNTSDGWKPIAFASQFLNSTEELYSVNELEQYFITSIDRYSKYPTAEILNNASGQNVIKFLNNYIYHHGVPRTIRLDQARCFTGKKFEIFCTENNIVPIYAPADDHRAIGLVELIIQTIKRQLSCMKSQLNKKINLENSLKAIIQRLRISKQKNNTYHTICGTLWQEMQHTYIKQLS